jgi:sulfite reductase (NADPH) hemoprotein beta-component
MAALRHPQILIASDLARGDVVVLGASGWERDHLRAKIAYDEEQAAALQAFAKAEVDANRVVDAYLVDVAVAADGAPAPLHFRERFRLVGPSVRPDLGKQAERRQGDGR